MDRKVRFSHRRAVLVVALFVAAACNDQPQGQTEDPQPTADDGQPVVVIDGQSVSRAEYNKALFDKFGENHLETFIEDRLIDMHAEKKGIKVDEAKVEAKVKKDVDSLLQTRFQGNEQALARALEERGMSLGGWKSDLAARARREQLLEKLIKAERTAEADVVRRKFEQKYGANGEKYRMRHLLISTKVVNSRFYSKDQYETEKPKIENELRAEAQKLHTEIKNGGDFEAMAKEHSDDFTASRGGNLGESWKGRFGREFDQAVERMNVGQVSAPIKSSRGFHIIEVTEVKKGIQYRGKAILVATGPSGPADRRSAEERKKDAEKKLAEIKKALSEGKKFEEVATELSDDLATKSRGGELGVFGRRRLGDEVDKVLETAKIGAVTDPIETRRGFWIVKLEDRKMVPKDDKKVVRHIFLSSEYNKVKKRQLEDTIDAMAKEKAEKLAEKIKAGGDFGQIAEAESEDAYTRKTGGEYLNYRETSLGPEVWEAVQALPAGNEIKIVKSNRGYHIVNVMEKSVTKFDDVKAELLKELNEQPVNPSESRQFLDRLKEEAKIERKIGKAPQSEADSKPAGDGKAATDKPKADGAAPADKPAAGDKPKPETDTPKPKATDDKKPVPSPTP